MSEKTNKKTGKGKGTTNAKGKLRQDASGQGHAKGNAEVSSQEKTLLGRPSEYDPDVAAEFCRRISLGRTVRSVAKDDDMPVASTVYRWLKAQAEFRENYALAKEQHCDAIAEEVLEISDDPRKGVIETTKEWGIEIKTGDMIDRAKLQVDARKWYLSKVMPKKYGEKVEQTVVGDPEKPVSLSIDVKVMASDELKDFIRAQTHGKKQ